MRNGNWCLLFEIYSVGDTCSQKKFHKFLNCLRVNLEKKLRKKITDLMWNDFDLWGQFQCFIQVIKTVHWGLSKSDFRVTRHLCSESSRTHRSFQVTTLFKPVIIWGAEFHTICFILPFSHCETSYNWMIIAWTWNSWRCPYYLICKQLK